MQEASGDVVTWTHDANYRLTREQRSGANAYDTTHTYDPVGNETLEQTDGQKTTFTYDVANQLTTKTAPAGTVTTYVYDQAGNLTDEQIQGSTDREYNWNDDNWMTRFALGANEIDYKYNADGLLIEREEQYGNHDSSKLLWDLQNVLKRTDANDETTAEFLYTLDPKMYGALISQRKGGTSHFYLFDALGSAMALATSSESLSDTYLYKAYGDLLARTGTTDNPFQWVGQVGYQHDDLIQGLASLRQYYVRARWYGVNTARWNSEDPIGIMQSRSPNGRQTS